MVDKVWVVDYLWLPIYLVAAYHHFKQSSFVISDIWSRLKNGCEFEAFYLYSERRGGMCMKIQIPVGYWVSNKIHWLGPRKTLLENTCITGEVIHKHKSYEYVSTTTSNF